MDVVTDSIVTGRRFRALAIVADFSRECPAIEVDASIGGQRLRWNTSLDGLTPREHAAVADKGSDSG